MGFRDRLIDRAVRKDWPTGRLEKKIKRREALRDLAGDAFGSIVVPLASGALSMIPFAGAAAKVVSTLPAVRAVPMLSRISKVGAVQFDAAVKESGSVPGALMRDAVPILEYIEDGEWAKVAASVAVVLAGVALVFLL